MLLPRYIASCWIKAGRSQPHRDSAAHDPERVEEGTVEMIEHVMAALAGLLHR